MRVEFRPTVLLAGAMMAGLVLVPVLNLLTPLFGIALMTQVHKRLSARALPDRRRSRSLPRVEPGSRPR
jgi:CysZ protein